MSKKSSSQGAKNSFLAHLRSGLFILLFAVLIASAYAAITYPANPNAVTGVVGMYVGKTPATYDGNAAGSYDTATGYCNSAFSGSHVCSPMEIVNTYNNNPSMFTGVTDIVWVSTGGTSTTTPQANDCSGWTEGDYPAFGTVWNFIIDSAGVQQCNSTHAYGCCR